MTPARPRVAGVLAALLLLLLTGLPAASASARDAQPRPAQLALVDRPLVVLVEQLTPRAPLDPAERFRLSGTIVNEGAVPVQDLRLSLVVGGVLRSRGALARADERRRPSGVARAVPLPLATALDPGASTTFVLDVPVGDLRLSRLGVYPVSVQATGRLVRETGRAASRTTLGSASTFVPWFPDGPPQRTRVAWLWPLVDQPRITPDNALLGDELESLLVQPGEESGGGRLGRLLGAARQAAAVPLTWAVDPDLLVAVDGMTRDYVVLESGEPRERAASPVAERWLGELQAGLREPSAGLLALPYADPDVVALTRPGSDLADDVEQLRRLGTRVAGELTGRPLAEELAWPPAGRLTPAALDASLAAGASAVVLDEAALAPSVDVVGRTPSTGVALPSPTAGDVTGLVVEQGLSRLLQASPADPEWQGARLAEQRWLAETAMIAAERPGEARTVLVAPDRRGDVVPQVATGALLDSARLPWLCPVALGDVAAGRATCPTPPAVPPGPDEPAPALGDDEPSALEERGALLPALPDEPALRPAYLDEVAGVDAAAEQFTDDVLLPGTEAATATKERLLKARARTESSAWRDAPRAGAAMLDLLADEVAELRGQVTLSTSKRVALSGSTGTINVNVSNALGQPVTVGVGLNDPIEARLTSTGTAIQQVPGSAVVQVPIEVAIRTSGQFVVRATLLDRNGEPFGEPAELLVRSTGYSRAAIAVTGLGAAGLLVAAGVRIARRALRRTPRTS